MIDPRTASIVVVSVCLLTVPMSANEALFNAAKERVTTRLIHPEGALFGELWIRGEWVCGTVTAKNRQGEYQPPKGFLFNTSEGASIDGAGSISKHPIDSIAWWHAVNCK